ncbi:TonB-dependent receptor [Emcibacter nanhaiensis]|nr:TonB-dependent receptor [Emcibacter nanhaiensis]
MTKMHTEKKALVRRRAVSLSAAVSLLVLAGPATSYAEMVLEEITVTAQKRSESLQDVGITMSAFTENDMKDLNVGDTQEIAANIPNVQVNYGFGQNAFNIRGLGINEFSSNLDSPVAVHLDEVYISKNFMTGMILFDVERVEALKGPQGTLFGRNTTGGSVNFYTRKPTEEFEAGATLGYGNYKSFQGEAYISGPLSDRVQGRLSGMFVDQGDGFYENVTLGEDEGKTKKYALRGQLQWTGEDTSVLGSLHYGKDTSEMPPYEGIGIFTPESLAAGTPAFCTPYLDGTVTGASSGCVRGTDGLYPGDDDPFTSEGDFKHDADNTSIGGMLRIEHDFDGLTLTSISGVEYFERDQRENSDGSPLSTIDVYWYQKITQYTQELRLTSDSDGIWNYILGAYYEHDDLEDADYLTVAAGAAPGYYTHFNQDVDALAVFFHNDIDVTDTLSLVAGVRWSWEKTAIDGGTSAGTGIISDGGIQMPDTILVDLAVSNDIDGGNSRTDEDVSFKVGIEWKPELSGETFDDLLVYFNISTGFRSGGYNAAFAGSQDAFTSLAPEKITAYEGGIKATLADRRLQWNAAVFRYDFRDGYINVDSDTAPVPVTINAADIETWGAETDLHWLPLDGMDIKLGAAWLDAAIESDITSGGTSLKGFHPVNSPEWSMNGQIRYEFNLTDDILMSVSGSANWRDKQYLEAINAPANLEDSYWLVDARATIFSADDSWSVSLWGKNLTDTEYRTYVNDLPGFGWMLNIYGPPRTYGITASFNF